MTRSKSRIAMWLLVAALAAVLIVLRWGGDWLIAADPAPAHVDAAVALQGSIVAEKVRIAGAIDLLRRGISDRVLLSVPKESFWGQSLPPVARTYIERNYGADLAARVDFCETGAEVNSTAQEAEALAACVRQYHWQAVAIVTSEYHTRRAGILWRKTAKHDPQIRVWIEAVPDPEFQRPWWRHRQSAKIWVAESCKLIWTALGG